MKISAVVAMAQNRVIGSKGKLPWVLPADLKRFREITIDHPIIMGRKTFESIGRLLPKRRNIIVTRDMDYRVMGAQVCHSLDQAIQEAELAVQELTDADKEIFIIGGAQIYELSLPRLDRIYLTVIHRDIEGDTHFPPLDGFEFVEASQEGHRSEEPPYTFYVLDRKV
jgi:dihydrofolate reductase